jgi:alpha-beta hydrolase superfamily lysophospholipase
MEEDGGPKTDLSVLRPRSSVPIQATYEPTKTPYQSRTFDIRGQKIHAMEAGKPGRQVALLIHGWSSSWYATSPMLGLLAQRFHCLAIDLPGYGQSPRLSEPTTIPRYVECWPT